MIEPSNVFKENLARMPAIDGIARIDLVNGSGTVVASIENKPGKQGSLAVYNYLRGAFGTLDAKAAEHGLALFAEHTADARNRPGAHPNVDHLLALGLPLAARHCASMLFRQLEAAQSLFRAGKVDVFLPLPRIPTPRRRDLRPTCANCSVKAHVFFPEAPGLASDSASVR
ncbi:hypothetical protein OKW28_001041 [Paraburkholderia sp. 40]